VDPPNLRQQSARLETRRHFRSKRVNEDWNTVTNVIPKIPGLSTPSKEPIDSPRRNLFPDPARGDYLPQPEPDTS
jgi:hypothetical protein